MCDFISNQTVLSLTGSAIESIAFCPYRFPKSSFLALFRALCRCEQLSNGLGTVEPVSVGPEERRCFL
jgi:hypothetical protein